MFTIRDYVPISTFYGTLVELKTELRFMYMLFSRMLLLTLILSLYTIVRWAVSVPVWITLWILVAAYYRYYNTGCNINTIKVVEIPKYLRSDDFVIINHCKEHILATELSHLVSKCQIDSMLIKDKVVPIYNWETLINQID